MIKKQILLSLLCLIAISTSLWGTGNRSNSPLSETEEVSGCQIVGEPRPICDWRADLETVLNACYTPGPGPNCQWWQGSNVYRSGSMLIVSGPDLTTAELMNLNAQSVATSAQNSPPADGYSLYSYRVELGTIGGGQCVLFVYTTWRKVSCEAPPSNG